MDKVTEIELQYEKIYRYCFFKIHNREIAEDITQETFLRFLESRGYRDTGKTLHYLYTIARNLCIDEYRKPPTESFNESASDLDDNFSDDKILNNISLQAALSELKEEDRELLLLRYANEVPITVISSILQISRFAIYRRLTKILNELQKKLM